MTEILYCQSPALFLLAVVLLICFFLRRQAHRVRAALDLILNSESTCVTPCGVVYDNDMKLEHHYDGQHFPCYLCQPAMLVVGIFPKNAPEGSSETTWLTLTCSEQ